MVDGLQELLRRIETGNFDEEDMRAIASAIQSKQIILATGQQAIGVGGNIAGSSINTGNDNISGNNNQVIKNGLSAEDLRLILQELKSFQTQGNSVQHDSQGSDQDAFNFNNEPLILVIDSEIVERINAHLAAIEELQKVGQLPDIQRVSFRQLKEEICSLQKLDKQLNNLADMASQILQDAIKSLEGELRELAASSEDILYDARSQICLQEQIDILIEFQRLLGEGKVVARWLERQRLQNLAEQLVQYALDNYPHIKETASPRRLEAFCFSIEQILERLSTQKW
jgi:hypothetical protein